MWGLRAMTAGPVNFYWPDQALLDELGIEMPMMEPGNEHFVNTASMKAGLAYRSLADTATGTLEWWQAQDAARRSNPRRWPTGDEEAAAITRLKEAKAPG
jgi:hypothetical protein